ncbi:MAG: RsmB/NOP family class I SAM-dependent RNA methyltransferase [Nitrososphaerota archaeon]|jgi:NOL1/NOP2/sun family putative RNA methylase|nr:RsmB/NOP family class I SAM-dependent RNA methyltransferase [Nitrososphaerota archaeon]
MTPVDLSVFEKLLSPNRQVLTVSGKEFFQDRYKQLGWELREIKLRQTIRINNTNAQGKNLIERLNSLGVPLQKIPFLQSGYWVLDSKVSAGATAEYLLGLYSIQEAAAQIPVSLFSDLKGKKVLDCAAAPGGKTVQLADTMDNTGAIVALDVDKRRLTALGNHLERCRITNTVVYLMDARQTPLLNIPFDRVLVDAPCSGNFAGDRDWFKNRTLKDIQRNAAIQKEILTKASECLSRNGELVYATCSLEPEENELNMDWAIKHLNLQIQEISSYGQNGLTEIFGRKIDHSVARCRRVWPNETQGFFVAKLKRS